MCFVSREASRLHLLPVTGYHFGAFSQLTSLELSAWDLGNLSQLPSFAGLVSALRSSVCFQRRKCAVMGNILTLAWCSVLGYISILRHPAQSQHHAQSVRKGALEYVTSLQSLFLP